MGPQPAPCFAENCRAMLQQSQALSSLVAHLVTQADTADVLTPAASLSLKGLGNLQTGSFLLQVGQNAHPHRPSLRKVLVHELPHSVRREWTTKRVNWLLAHCRLSHRRGHSRGGGADRACHGKRGAGCPTSRGVVLNLLEDPPPHLFVQRPARTPAMGHHGPFLHQGDRCHPKPPAGPPTKHGARARVIR